MNLPTVNIRPCKRLTDSETGTVYNLQVSNGQLQVTTDDASLNMPTVTTHECNSEPAPTEWYNEEQEYTATPTCPEGQVGDPVTVTKAAGQYRSEVDQADANALALAAAKAEAEAQLVCEFPNVEVTATCPTGYTGDPVTIPAGTYTAPTQEEADALAVAAAEAQLTCTEDGGGTPCGDQMMFTFGNPVVNTPFSLAFEASTQHAISFLLVDVATVDVCQISLRMMKKAGSAGTVKLSIRQATELGSVLLAESDPELVSGLSDYDEGGGLPASSVYQTVAFSITATGLVPFAEYFLVVDYSAASGPSDVIYYAKMNSSPGDPQLEILGTSHA